MYGCAPSCRANHQPIVPLRARAACAHFQCNWTNFTNELPAAKPTPNAERVHGSIGCSDRAHFSCESCSYTTLGVEQTEHTYNPPAACGLQTRSIGTEKGPLGPSFLSLRSLGTSALISIKSVQRTPNCTGPLGCTRAYKLATSGTALIATNEAATSLTSCSA